ncbi:MAG: hypothetical protein BIP78_1042 [Candidatus Bipolaricaulis sibiricus]|uniref:Uncharacterized protein n=1 Tax=Bipolaricaulis sibiricus TaxID=2501609 RepID=A0A410FV28_BIPS1|nr:MAG: hypothetical protein BIP78_1042 [Candidatus Bipolaricaulis sibiricus]
MPRTVAFLFDSGGGDLVGRTRTAAARAVARRVGAHPEVTDVVVATPYPQLWSGERVVVEEDPPGPWRFGARLTELARKFRADRLLYFSAGSGFLLTDDLLDRLITARLPASAYAVLNNFYSTDFGLIVPPPALGDLMRDNPIGARLWGAGYACYELPRSAGTQFDVDTPGELQILALHPALGAELREVLAAVPTERAQAVLDVLVDSERELVILGRVGGHLARWLEGEAACRVRIVSEERGMESSGRAERGAVRSLIGALAHGRTMVDLVELLSQFGDAVVWDTRVLMAHLGFWPTPAERFASDLLDQTGTSHPVLRELIGACRSASVPFLLGGHALVSGGMYLAVELAWEHADRAVRFRPLPLPD